MMNPSSSDQTVNDQSLKKEKRDTEIDQLAKKIISENKIKMNLLQRTAVTQDYKAPTKQTPAIEPQSEDSTSAYGQFGWTEFANTCFPYIMRSGQKYIALRMLAIKVFPQYPSKEVSLCIDVDRFQLTNVEARLLNEINVQHCDNFFGSASFTNQENIIHLEDAMEIHKFFEFCYSRVRQPNTSGDKRCGFVRVATECFLPFVWWDSKQYVPLFYLTGELRYLEEKSVELKGWGLTYLKFLCKVHNTFKSMPDQNSIHVVDLEIVKQCFHPGTPFEEMWPKNNKLGILLGQAIPDANRAENANTKKRKNNPLEEAARNNMPGAKKQSTQSQTTVALACTNVVESSSVSAEHFLSINQQTKSKAVQPKQYPGRGQYNAVNINLGRPTQSGGRLSEVVAKLTSQTLSVTPTVFTNITNLHKQPNKDQQFHLPSLMFQTQPISAPNRNNNRGCVLYQILDFPPGGDRTGYTLSSYEIFDVTLEYSINFAPNDDFVLVTVSEVACKLLKVPYPVLKRALDYLRFVVFMPNRAQADLLTSVGIYAGVGLVSGLDIMLYFDTLKQCRGVTS